KVQGIPDVEEVMVTKPVTVTSSRGMAESLKIMENNRVDSLIVVDEKKQLLGYITVFDVVNAYEKTGEKVHDIMHPFKHIVYPDTSLSDAIDLMNKLDTPYVPVVNQEDYLKGILTRGSIVGFVGNTYSLIEEGVM